MNHQNITPNPRPLSSQPVSAVSAGPLPARAPYPGSNASTHLAPISRMGDAGQASYNSRLVSMLRKVEPIVFSSGGAALHAELVRLLDMTMGGFGRRIDGS